MKKVACFAGLLASTALLAACNSGSSEPAATDSSTDTAMATTAAETAAPAAAPSAAAAAPAADNTDTTDGTKLADFTGDAVHGKAIFMQCMSCHSRDPGVNKIGPSLANVVGRKAGSIADYQYSAANKGSGITWTPEKLFQYLQAPQRVVPGTKMTFVGLPKAQDRADVIAFLQSPPA